MATARADNPDNALPEKQVEYTRTIHAAGSDLLTLINDILDLSKIESGTSELQPSEVRFADLRDFVERTLRPCVGAGALPHIRIPSAKPSLTVMPAAGV